MAGFWDDLLRIAETADTLGRAGAAVARGDAKIPGAGKSPAELAMEATVGGSTGSPPFIPPSGSTTGASWDLPPMDMGGGVVPQYPPGGATPPGVPGGYGMTPPGVPGGYGMSATPAFAPGGEAIIDGAMAPVLDWIVDKLLEFGPAAIAWVLERIGITGGSRRNRQTCNAQLRQMMLDAPRIYYILKLAKCGVEQPIGLKSDAEKWTFLALQLAATPGIELPDEPPVIATMPARPSRGRAGNGNGETCGCK